MKHTGRREDGMASDLKPPRMPTQAQIHLVRTTLESRPAWCWQVRARDGRLLAIGIRWSREKAIERALENFPRAVLVEEA